MFWSNVRTEHTHSVAVRYGPGERWLLGIESQVQARDGLRALVVRDTDRDRPGDRGRDSDRQGPGEEIPLYVGQKAVEDAYAAAERDGRPFLAVEQYDQGYAVTYDLLPAGQRLTRDATDRVAERLTTELESIVGDDEGPTDLSRTVGKRLGNVSTFDRESTARRVAGVAAEIVLGQSHWAGHES